MGCYVRVDLIAKKRDILFPPRHGNRYTNQEDSEESDECKEISRAVRILTKVKPDFDACPTRKAAKSAGMSHDTSH